ncbi:Mitochondrial import inner membrane translocase subunit TIM9 [Bifiguratus adelaidae]|uniref:Mitochondrial import inner membrane translocase subunit n=1 Tax=Bifiguratus adelaidae TaxID=1938954 RepID=A0A261Y5Q2_9FUNG|nr:Mitochondrial import inner membrane translocase subunit TIM9 [Bifiguratus adelaidae]
MDFSRFNQAEQTQIAAMIEHKQMKDFLRLYANLVERCFNDCVNDFTSKTVSGKEEQCVNRCADKFLKHSERVGARFAELSQQMMPGMQQPPQ